MQAARCGIFWSGTCYGGSELCGAAMSGVAALPGMSLPDIATAMPTAGATAPGTSSIFDDLLAALAPIVSDQTPGPALAATPAEPSVPTLTPDAALPQILVPDATSLGATLGD